MKRAAIMIAVLGMCTGSFGQSNDKPAGQTSQPAQPAGQAAAAAPQGKRPPEAKTQPEYEAYKAASAQTDPAALEKAADDFAAKFPDSELRALVYTAAMQRYQQANNADKMIDMGKKILAMIPMIRRRWSEFLRPWRSGRATRIWIKMSVTPKPRSMQNMRW